VTNLPSHELDWDQVYVDSPFLLSNSAVSSSVYVPWRSRTIFACPSLLPFAQSCNKAHACLQEIWPPAQKVIPPGLVLPFPLLLPGFTLTIPLFLALLLLAPPPDVLAASGQPLLRQL
jgi:hypothetical protein